MMQNSKNCPFCNNTNNDHHIPLQQSETLNLRLKEKETDLKKKEEEIVSLQSQVCEIKLLFMQVLTNAVWRHCFECYDAN